MAGRQARHLEHASRFALLFKANLRYERQHLSKLGGWLHDLTPR